MMLGIVNASLCHASSVADAPGEGKGLDRDSPRTARAAPTFGRG
jgi:hypothetical protein